FEGSQYALEFLTGYVIEQSLSIDNLFVILLIFRMHHIPQSHQHRVLFLGILGALIMRGMMILGGVHLINTFHWMTYLFGIFLIYAAVTTFSNHLLGEEVPESSLIRWLKKHLRVTKELRDQHFFVWEVHRFYVTPLFISLIFIEFADLLFALDSIPAIL